MLHNNHHSRYMYTMYRIAGKFGGELNLALWRIDQPTAKLKIRQYLIRVYTYVRKINNGCGRSRASARAHCRSQLFFDVHARRCKILLLLTMSLYRLFTKAGMSAIAERQGNRKRQQERARAWAWLYSQVSRPPIFLFTLVGANPPNLMPAKFSGYTVLVLIAGTEIELYDSSCINYVLYFSPVLLMQLVHNRPCTNSPPAHLVFMV